MSMNGHITHGGREMRGGFMSGGAGGASFAYNGAMPALMEVNRAELAELLGRSEKQLAEATANGTLQRSEFTGDLSSILSNLNMSMAGMQRALTASEAPMRENLESPAVSLVPLETPLRNMLPRIAGSGTAVAWKQLSSLGGGYGISTTVTSGASSATQTVGNTNGMKAGDVLYFATTAASRTVSSITNGTTVVLTATISTTTSEVVTRTSVVQPGGGSVLQMFYSETGAPVEFEETYVSKSADYKLLGAFGKITNLAVAAGRSYQDQLAAKRVNTLRNLMLNEEYALTSGNAATTTAPWGDGSNALAFNGINNLVTTANGAPTAHVQTSVGALTTAHIDSQLTNIWEQGGRGLYMLLSGQEINSLSNLAEASGSIIRVQAISAGDVVLGLKVSGYVHPISGEVCSIMPSRFQDKGTITFGSKEGPEDAAGDGSRAPLVVNVLPQVPLPADRPEGVQEIQGYVVTEMSRELASADVLPHMVSVYETLQMRNAKIFAKSTGVTAT